jgi:hypothetical protein
MSKWLIILGVACVFSRTTRSISGTVQGGQRVSLIDASENGDQCFGKTASLVDVSSSTNYQRCSCHHFDLDGGPTIPRK